MGAIIQTLFVGAIFVFLARHFYLWQQFRGDVSRIFSKPQIEGPDREAIEEALKVLNQESSTFLFTMNRFANVSFHGQVVSIVDGRVGYVSHFENRLGGWMTKCSVFAVADSAKSKWMQDNAEFFTPIFLGTAFSVFSVKLGAF